jgi:NRPS condensation-like uncharacterized protein
MVTKTHENFIRPLNKTEQAYTIINDFYPFTATCILKLGNTISENVIREVLNCLQISHPLLKAVIKEKDGQFWFENNMEGGPIPLDIVSRRDGDHWYEVVRNDLNKGVPTKASPLLKVSCIASPSLSGPSEIVFSFHHAIIDAGTFIAIANQFLSLAGEGVLEKHKLPLYPVSPDMDRILPSSFKGYRFFYRLLPFMLRQIIDDIQYKKVNASVIDSAIPASSDNDILTLAFSKEETETLVRWSRKKRVSINSLLTSAMLKVVNKYNYEGQKKRMRTIQFGNLRPYLQQSVPANTGGCFVSMMRFTLPMDPNSGLDQMAAMIDTKSLKAGRRGDKFMFALLGKMLVKKTIKAHNERLAASALSYAGPVRLKEQYGDIRLLDVHGFVTNNCLGAEFTGLAKIFFGKLSLDLNFLTAEINSEKAKKMATELKLLLLNSTKE